MEVPSPQHVEQMLPVQRHGSIMHVPVWAFRALIGFVILLLAGALTTFGVGLNDYFNTRSLVTIHEAERQEIKLAKAQAAMNHEARLAVLEKERKEEAQQGRELSAEVQLILRKLDVLETTIKSRMP